MTPSLSSVKTLFLPYELGVTADIFLTAFTMNSYPVDVATSIRGIETRTLLPGTKDKGSISLTMKDIEEIGLETLMQFYDLCSGPLLAFEIRDDHPIWVDCMPPFTRYHWYPLWRFTDAIAPTCTDPSSCSWDVSFTLTNVPI